MYHHPTATTTIRLNCHSQMLLLFYAVAATGAFAFPLSQQGTRRIDSVCFKRATTRLFYSDYHEEPRTQTAKSDYYTILGVSQEASNEEIKSAFRRLAKEHHPDVNPQQKDTATERFQVINQAFQVLSDEVTRRQYNAEISKSNYNNNSKRDSSQRTTKQPGRRQWYESSPFRNNDNTYASTEEEWPYTRYREQRQQHQQARQVYESWPYYTEGNRQEWTEPKTESHRQRYASSWPSSSYGSDNPDFGKEIFMNETKTTVERHDAHQDINDNSQETTEWTSPWMWVKAPGKEKQREPENVDQPQNRPQPQETAHHDFNEMERQLGIAKAKAVEEERLRKAAEALVSELRQQLNEQSRKLTSENDQRRATDKIVLKLQTQLKQLEERISQLQQERRKLLLEQKTRIAEAEANAQTEEQMRLVAERSVRELQKRVQALKEEFTATHQSSSPSERASSPFLSFFSTQRQDVTSTTHQQQQQQHQRPQFGLTKDGQPCKRCLKNGSLCWQHQQIDVRQGSK